MSDATIQTIVISVFGFLGTVAGIVGSVILATINRKVNTVKEDVGTVKKSIDGLLEQKTKADIDIGRVRELERAEKEEGIANKARLEMMKEQQLLNQIPPNAKSDVKEVKDEIVKAVKEKGDETQGVVEKIPDEVIKKLPDKK